MNKPFPILLVDDDENISIISQRAAKASFPEATFTWMSNASMAEDYFDLSTSSLPKLVLVDIDLNGPLTGLDLIIYLRANQRTCLVPLVVLTGTDRMVTVHEAYQLGASTFTSKPASYSDWQNYFTLVRAFWFEAVVLPAYPRC